MPIYAYRCSACGHAQDVLQKISAPLLTVCPACGQSTYSKQVTAAGFQLKGSGWYVTDFRDGNAGAKKKEAADGAAAPAASDAAAGASTSDKPAASPSGDAKPAEAAAPKTADKKAADKPAAPSTAPSTGT